MLSIDELLYLLYFLLGIFWAFRGDMSRYFKYRRVCMSYLTKIEVGFWIYHDIFCRRAMVRNSPKILVACIETLE